MTDPNIGRLIANRYELEELIGRGSMGKVYRAKDRLLGNVPVAVKFLAKTLLNDKMQQQFRSEAKTCAQLGQKTIHIVRVMDYGVGDDEIPFYVMEYLQGESLLDLVKNRALALPRFLTLTRQICLGLQCAHQDGVIHRDIKPRNILIVQDSSIGEMAKILDFGIARLMEEEGPTNAPFMGTLAYASPEQMESKDLDNRSDIYSLGVMMYEMITYRLPIQAASHTFQSWYKAHRFQTPQSLENAQFKVPKALENLVMSCLEKKPSDRPQNIEEILKALEPLDDRFSGSRQVTQRLEMALNKVQVVPKPDAPDFVSADNVFKFMSWPKDKPIAEIVFPQVVPTSRESLATLWIMMSQEGIESRRKSRRYNRFLFTMVPQPMVLWLTVIYNREEGPRWLPVYLDLKTRSGLEIAELLAEKGYYRLLFFATEAPQQCANIMACTIHPDQCRELKEWVVSSRVYKASGHGHVSKANLKEAFESLKPKILLQLEGSDTNPGS